MRAQSLLACAALLLATACSEDFYVVGALCTAVGTCPDGTAGSSAGGAAAGGAGTAGAVPDAGPLPDGGGGAPPLVGLALDLMGTGPGRLPETFGGAQATHLLIATDATDATWDARVGTGFDVMAPASLAVGLPWPFSDSGTALSHADTTTFTSDATWADSSAGAFALEAVFRGEPGALLLSQRDASGGVQLSVDMDGQLSFLLSSGGTDVLVTSLPLVNDAWHHCIALFDSMEATAQVICNGHALLATNNVPAGFTVTTPPVPTTLGGESPARLQWAELGRWEAQTWGPRGAWVDLARERFTRLVGTYVTGAEEPLPFADVRASGAYIDMTSSTAPDVRHLHPVGEHWPRIVCRPTADEARTCGLLIEHASSQTVAPAAFTLDNWNATELTVTEGGAAGPFDADTLFGLTPTAQAAAHTLELSVPAATGPAVLSFFARAGSGRLLRMDVVGTASAVFDVEASSVVESTDTVVVTAEPWGDGLTRISYSFPIAAGAGPQPLRLTVLADDGTDAFAGDGTVALYVGDGDLHFRSNATPLPTFGAIQQRDHLVYPAGKGNLPEGPWFSVTADIWLPDAPLIDDASIFNANFAGTYDQQINVFVLPMSGTTQFNGLRDTQALWLLSNPQVVTDGALHKIVASVGPDGATLSVDGDSATASAEDYDLTTLDRIEIGGAENSSGPLTGLVRSLRVEPLSE